MSYINPTPQIDDNNTEVKEDFEDYTCEKEVYFVFIDVLGFKNAFTQSESLIETPMQYNKIFKYYFALMNAANFMKNNTGCYAGQTSDSLYFYTSRIDYLMQFIVIYSHFCLYAMSQNVFFRGGIAKGNLYKKEMYQFYGSSIINAFLLESNVSKNPIVTIDEKTYKDMKCIPDYKKIIIESNGRQYINIFASIKKEIPFNIINNFAFENIDIKKIKNNIENNRCSFEYDLNNYSKYVFLKKEFEKYTKDIGENYE